LRSYPNEPHFERSGDSGLLTNATARRSTDALLSRGLSALRALLPISLLSLSFIAISAAGEASEDPGVAAAIDDDASWHAPLSDGAEIDLPPLDSGVPSPLDVLGYPLGERFTPGHHVSSYLQRVAIESPRARLWSYGRSYEGRPLQVMAISSPENLTRLDEIREEHLARLSALDGDRPVPDSVPGPAIVWLSYGVHGNESSSTEAAMATAYVLNAGEGAWPELLEDVVVLLDPLTNPDGRARYVHHYTSRAGRVPDPDSAAAEHREPWPGGRQNHYLTDLNRDWMWLSQIETEHRVAAFREWEPHVFVDLHEMSPDSSYFFPPAATPVHPLIDQRTVNWLETFGAENALAFEEQGWLFYTGEQYDLFYPGYGDSYPSLRNSVGMTFEMAGGGSAGLTLKRRTGSTLRLADRTARHLTTSLATVRTAALRRDQLVADQLAARSDALANASGIYLWSAQEDHADAAASLLRSHGIEVKVLAKAWRGAVRSMAGGEPIERDFPAGAYAVDTHQALGNLVRTLFELEAELDPDFIAAQRARLDAHRDTQFYDITAWCLPLAYDFAAWKAEEIPADHLTEAAARKSHTESIEGTGDFGYVVPPQGLRSFQVAAALQRERISYRQLQPHAGSDDGALFIPRRSLGGRPEAELEDLLASSGALARRVETGYDENGTPFGSEEHPSISRSRIGLVMGDGISPTTYGHLWHLLDRTIEASHHQLRARDLVRALGGLDVVVLPPGDAYDQAIGEEDAGRLKSWVESGGVLVAIGETSDWLREASIISPDDWPEPEESDGESAFFVPGAILQTTASPYHPIFAGLEHAPPVLFEGDTPWLATGDVTHDLLVVTDEDPVVAGFAWPESESDLAGALLVGEFRYESGRVIVFSQNPAFRNFWRATMPLFLNAVLHGPSWN